MKDWLKSIGCCFYDPLREDSCDDVICGSVFTVANQQNVIWCSEYESWMFKTIDTTPESIIGEWHVDFEGMFDLNNMEYTMVFDINVIKNGLDTKKDVSGFVVPLRIGDSDRFNVANCAPILNTWYRIVYVWPKYNGSNDRYSMEFSNGLLVNRCYINSVRMTCSETHKNRITTGNAYRYMHNYSGVEYCLKNAMIFTKALDVDVIMKIGKNDIYL